MDGLHQRSWLTIRVLAAAVAAVPTLALIAVIVALVRNNSPWEGSAAILVLIVGAALFVMAALNLALLAFLWGGQRWAAWVTSVWCLAKLCAFIVFCLPHIFRVPGLSWPSVVLLAYAVLIAATGVEAVRVLATRSSAVIRTG